MYALKTDCDLSALENRSVIQLCFGENEIVLNLDDSTSVMVSSQVLNGARAPMGREAMLNMIGKEILRARVLDAHSVQIDLRDFGAVVLNDDAPGEYESIVIKGPTLSLVV